MLHDPKWENSPSHIDDVNDWWRGPGTCINGSWRKFDRAIKHDEEKKAGAEQPQPAPLLPPDQNGAADAAGQKAQDAEADPHQQQQEPQLP